MPPHASQKTGARRALGDGATTAPRRAQQCSHTAKSGASGPPRAAPPEPLIGRAKTIAALQTGTHRTVQYLTGEFVVLIVGGESAYTPMRCKQGRKLCNDSRAGSPPPRWPAAGSRARHLRALDVSCWPLRCLDPPPEGEGEADRYAAGDPRAECR